MEGRAGQQFGNYRLLHLLGQGGFAEVYLGEHVYLGTHAANKVLHTRLSKDDLEGFRDEARNIGDHSKTGANRLLGTNNIHLPFE